MMINVSIICSIKYFGICSYKGNSLYVTNIGEDITDKKEMQERRIKGIVLHLLATDGETARLS